MRTLGLATGSGLWLTLRGPKSLLSCLAVPYRYTHMYMDINREIRNYAPRNLENKGFRLATYCSPATNSRLDISWKHRPLGVVLVLIQTQQ